MLFSTERKLVQLRAIPIAAALALLTLLSSGVAQADFNREFSFDASELSIGNLIGEVTVEASTSDQFEVIINVRGDDATEERINFETEEGSNASLFVGFPVEESRRFVYPEIGRGTTKFSFGRSRDDNSFLGSLFREIGRKKIEVRGNGRGLEIWADIVVRVPDGAQLNIRNGAGRIEAEDVDAKLSLDIHSGSISAEAIGDDLLCDTGSGHVDVRGVEGSVSVDTGSGHVDVSGVKGQYCKVDTGSGHVNLTDIVAAEVDVDTGSGKVELENVECDTVVVDTGSGAVDAGSLSASDVSIDTGSGRVRLELTQMGDGDFSVDTGSGGITMVVPESAAARFRAHAGNGGVDIDIDDIDVRRVRRDSVDFEMGGGGAEVSLETSSGAIRISAR